MFFQIKILAISALLFSGGVFAQSSSTATTGASSGSAAGTSTVSVPDRSPWGLSYFAFTMADKTTVDNKTTGASWMMDQYLAAGYKIDSTQKVSARFGFVTLTGGDTGRSQQNAETKIGDFSLSYNNYSLWKGDDWGLSGTFYMYLPLKESSLEKEWITRLKSWLILSNQMSARWTFTYNLEPNFYVSRNAEYSVTKPNRKGVMTTEWNNSAIGDLKQYASFSYSANSVFEPFVSGGFAHFWNQTSPLTTQGPSYSESIRLAVGTWVKPHRNFRFIAQVENGIDTEGRRPGKPYGVARSQDMSYQLLLFGTIL